MNFLAFSQDAKITYVASATNYVKKLKEENNSKEFLNEQSSSNIEFTLYIRKNKSYYKKNESLKIDNNSINLTAVFAGSGTYYYNLTTNKNLHEKENRLLGSDFLIEYEKINWKLTNETKKIGKYTCLKATATIKRRHRNGVREKKITAWYTPEIPLNFGPKFYNGLPGLILSIQEGNKLYLTAKFIDLNPKDKVSFQNPPNNSEKISFKDYEILLLDKFNQFRKERNK